MQYISISSWADARNRLLSILSFPCSTATVRVFNSSSSHHDLYTGRQLHTYLHQTWNTALPFIYLPSRRLHRRPLTPHSRQPSIPTGSGLDPSRCSSFSSLHERERAVPQVNGSFTFTFILNLISIYINFVALAKSRNLNLNLLLNIDQPTNQLSKAPSSRAKQSDHSKVKYPRTDRLQWLRAQQIQHSRGHDTCLCTIAQQPRLTNKSQSTQIRP